MASKLELSSTCSSNFNFNQFLVCKRIYEGWKKEKNCWNDLDSIYQFVENLEEKARIIGHINAKKPKKLLNWNFGKPYVVTLDGDFVFCNGIGNVAL